MAAKDVWVYTARERHGFFEKPADLKCVEIWIGLNFRRAMRRPANEMPEFFDDPCSSGWRPAGAR